MADDCCDLLCLDLPRAEALRATRVSAGDAQDAARSAAAFGDQTRVMLAAALRESGSDGLCVCDLAWVTERSQNLVSHHLRALRTAGLVHSRREGKMVFYALTEHGLRLLALLLDPAEAPA